MIGLYAVAPMPHAEFLGCRQNDIELMEIVDHRRQHSDQLDLLAGQVCRK